MKFEVMTLFPQMIQDSCAHSIMKRAVEQGIISVGTVNPRDFTEDKHKKVDDSPYGGGAGMVLMVQPFMDAFDSIEKDENTEVIMLTPQGERFDQDLARKLSKKEKIVLICGHYEGFDERIRTLTKAREVSIGDFVLTGGELPALCIMDSITRFVEGALGKSESAEYDSFSDGLLEYPQYTKPREFRGLKVPEVLLNGNHAEIEKWRKTQQILKTQRVRPDLLH